MMKASLKIVGPGVAAIITTTLVISSVSYFKLNENENTSGIISTTIPTINIVKEDFEIDPINSNILEKIHNVTHDENEELKSDELTKILQLKDPHELNTALNQYISNFKGDSLTLAKLLLPNKLPESSIWGVIYQVFERVNDINKSVELYYEIQKLNLTYNEKLHLNSYLSLRLFEKDTSFASEWLLSVSDNEAQEADSQALLTLYKNGIDEPVQLLQKLLDNNKTSRFEACAKDFVNLYKGKDSLACLNWTLSLPKELPSRLDLVISAYTQIYFTDRNSAIELKKKIPELKSLSKFK